MKNDHLNLGIVKIFIIFWTFWTAKLLMRRSRCILFPNGSFFSSQQMSVESVMKCFMLVDVQIYEFGSSDVNNTDIIGVLSLLRN